MYYKSEKNDGEDVISSTYGLEYPETNVMFSLSCGSRSSPAVSIITVAFGNIPAHEQCHKY